MPPPSFGPIIEAIEHVERELRAIGDLSLEEKYGKDYEEERVRLLRMLEGMRACLEDDRCRPNFVPHLAR